MREHTGSCGDQLSCDGGSGSGRSSAADWGWKNFDGMLVFALLWVADRCV